MIASRAFSLKSITAETPSWTPLAMPVTTTCDNPCSSRKTSLNTRDMTSPCWRRPNQPAESRWSRSKICRRTARTMSELT